VISSGQLGQYSSSPRYKHDIHYIGMASSGLMKLRPVVFRYRSDPSRQRQYGLIAEEVARVYPELVDYDNAGKSLTVSYLELNAMLLNELPKQARENKELSQENRELPAEVEQVRAEQARERASFDQRLATLEQSAWASKPDARLSGRCQNCLPSNSATRPSDMNCRYLCQFSSVIVVPEAMLG
jgi:hypothetical protein